MESDSQNITTYAKYAPKVLTVAVVISALVLFAAVLPVVIADDVVGSELAKGDENIKKLRSMKGVAIVLALVAGVIVIMIAMALGSARLVAKVAESSPGAAAAIVGNANAQNQVKGMVNQFSALVGVLTIVFISAVVTGFMIWSVEYEKTKDMDWHKNDFKMLISSTVITAFLMACLAFGVIKARGAVKAMNSVGNVVSAVNMKM